MEYAVIAAADSRLIEPRIMSLDAGERQLGVGNTDTPLLYLFYLPLLLGLSAWGVWVLLSEPLA